MEVLERKSTPCPFCGAADGLVLTQHAYNKEYRCKYCGRDYVVAGGKSDPFGSYRDLLIEYTDLDESMVADKFEQIQKQYPAFVKYDPQFCLVKIACLTKNFRMKYNTVTEELMADLEALYSTMKELLHSENHYPFDGKGIYLHKRYLKWHNYRKKKIIKTASIAFGALAVLAVPFFIIDNAERDLKDESSGISVSVGKGDYGLFEKYSVELDVEELVAGSTKHEQASILLKNEATKYKIYDLNIVKGTDKTQPNGEVEVTMPLPKDFSVKNIAIYYIAEDGKCQILDSQVNEIADTVTFSTDHFSLYAVAEHPFTVTFQTGFEFEIPSQSMLWGNYVEEPEEMEREGYTFGGWYDGDEKWNFSADILSKDTVLVAKWTGNPYTITYDANGGQCVEMQTVICGDDVKLSVPTRNGYKFKGWYDQWGALFADGVWTTAHNVSLTAKWQFDVSQIGKYVENGASVTDVDTKKTYTVFNNMAKTPKLNSANGMKTDGSIIIDWSKYADGEYDYASLCCPDGNRYGGGDTKLDIDGIVKEVYFIGNPTATYTNVQICARNYNRYDLTLYFENFNMCGSVKQVDCVALSATFECVGSSSVKAYAGQSAIDGFDSCSFVGDGSFAVYGGNGNSGANGGDAIRVTSLEVNNGYFKAVGGNGGDGANGGNGGNGGVAVRCTHLTVKNDNQKEAYDFFGGNGGNGGNGADGRNGNASGTSGDSRLTGEVGVNGGNGGNGGSGNAAVNGETFDCYGIAKLYNGIGGNGGNGGHGGHGGEGTGTPNSYASFAGNGGKGGNGGNGGNAGLTVPSVNSECVLKSYDKGMIVIDNSSFGGRGGDGGNGGNGGNGGCGITRDSAYDSWCWHDNSDGKKRAMNGGDGANGGNGGNAGYGEENGNIGSKGNGGAGGARGHWYRLYWFQYDMFEGNPGSSGVAGVDGKLNQNQIELLDKTIIYITANN